MIPIHICRYVCIPVPYAYDMYVPCGGTYHTYVAYHVRYVHTVLLPFPICMYDMYVYDICITSLGGRFLDRGASPS